MRQSVRIGADYVRAEIHGRETAEQTRQFVAAQLAALRESGLRKLLVSVRRSSALFKVEGWDLSRTLDDMAGMAGLKVALVSDSPELASSHQYVELLARQRRLDFRSFRDESTAVQWLLSAET